VKCRLRRPGFRAARYSLFLTIARMCVIFTAPAETIRPHLPPPSPVSRAELMNRLNRVNSEKSPEFLDINRKR